MYMYRPTVRYHDIYRRYVDSLFKATTLDRNQIFRLALFTAAHNPDFITLLKEYKRKDVPLPSPQWSHFMDGLWLETDVEIEEVGRRVNDNPKGARASSNDSEVFGTPGISESISQSNFAPNESTYITPSAREQHRRQQQRSRSERKIPPIRLSNGGIKLDLR